jgi:hypothetical protein
MRRLPRLVAVVLVLALAGGAQACAALCAKPVQPAAAPVAVTPEKGSSCGRHCGGSKTEAAKGNEPKPEPAKPCEHCKGVVKDRVAGERDHLAQAALELGVFAPLLICEPVVGVDRAVALGDAPVPAPPNERLHHVCVLLI